MSKEFEVNGVQYMAVEVPRDATEWRIAGNFLQMWPYRDGIMQKMLPAGTWEIVGLVGKLSLSDIHFKVFSYKSSYYDPEADSRESEAALYNEFTELCEKHNLNDNSLIIKKI